MNEKYKAWTSLFTAGGSLMYALLQFWKCKVEHAEMQAAVQALADALFR